MFSTNAFFHYFGALGMLAPAMLLIVVYSYKLLLLGIYDF
jgi:hypothetical protein